MEQRIFRRHDVDTSNNRAVRPGNDPLCITGYHMLWHGFRLQGDQMADRTDIAVAPLDAPDNIPAGGCQGSNSETTGTRHASQQTIMRDWT